MSIEVDDIHRAAPDPLALAHMLGLQVDRKSRNDRALVLCPWHSEKHPSCTITSRDGRIVAYCQSCRQGGDLLHLVAITQGLDTRADFPAVVARSAELFGVLDRDEPRAPRTTSLKPSDAEQLVYEVTQAGEDWLAGRPPREFPAIASATPGDILWAIETATKSEIAETKRFMERDDLLDRMEVPEWRP